MKHQIHEITGIAQFGHLKEIRLSQFSIDERMAWAAKRKTTLLEEDQVYCLLGIFEVHLPLIYGERREYALSRLQAEIERRSGQYGKVIPLQPYLQIA